MRATSIGLSINVSGVRNSWLTLEKNAVFARPSSARTFSAAPLLFIGLRIRNCGRELARDQAEEAAIAFVNKPERIEPGNQHARASRFPDGEIGTRAACSGRPVPGSRRKSSWNDLVQVDNNFELAPAQNIIVQRLLGKRWTIRVVSNGSDALEAMRERKPDLVLSDVMMPELDGFALLRRIREDSALRDVPVIMLSARAGEEARIEGLDAGADDYLTKPFSTRELIARVNANLQLARVRREAPGTSGKVKRGSEIWPTMPPS